MIKDISYVELSYAEYCRHIDLIAEGKAVEVSDIFGSTFKKIQEMVKLVSEHTKLGIEQIIVAAKNRQFFGLMKAIGFNVLLVFKAFNAAAGLVKQGLFKVLIEMTKNKAFDKLKSGAMKIDEFLKRYPLLKKLSGPIVAALLLYLWINCTFIGNTEFDLDLTMIHQALFGKYSLETILADPQGLSLIAAFAFSTATGLSFPWLASNIGNLVLGIIYTTYKNAGGKSATLKSLKDSLLHPVR